MSMTIAHASALSAEDEHIFEHALALACAADARLFTVNAHDGSAEEKATPDAAKVLVGWGRDADSVKHEAMIHTCCDDPVDTLLDAIRRVAPDLIVAGTHQRGAASRLLSGSQCEALLRNVMQPTLVFPMGARSFVNKEGEFNLSRILVPVGDANAARTAIAQATWLGEVAGVEALEMELLFVGDDADAPPVEIPRRAGWSVHMTTAKGSIADAVVSSSGSTCVIVMATRGRDSLKDSLFGTNTEQVLRKAKCPVLIAPMGAT